MFSLIMWIYRCLLFSFKLWKHIYRGFFYIFVTLKECIHIFGPGHFIVFFQNVDLSLYKDVFTFSFLYRNVSIF